MGQIIKVIVISFCALFLGAVLVGLVITAPIGWALVAFSVGYPLWKIYRALMRGSVKVGQAGGEILGRAIAGKDNTDSPS